MVEVVGRNTFHTAACHCHSGIGFETCHTEEGYQRSGNIFTDTATVGIIHLGIVKGITFAFAHRDAGVTDIVGNPVGEDGYLFHFCFLPFDKGEIRLKGTQLSQLDEGQIAKVRNEQLGFVFQDFMLLDGLTVFENVCVPKVIKNEPYKPMEKKARELLKMFGIEHIADKFPAEISGGQKQRVAVARSLMNDPFLILADEPTGNLDSRSSEAVIQAFIEAKEQLGATTLMVTHDTFSASYCDRVIMMKDGSVHSELVNHGDRKAFLEDLLNVLRELNGGDDHDVA